MAYGVLPTGYARKPLPVILAEIEAAAKLVFGAGLIQDDKSPMGMLNGLCASLVSTAWEIGEDTYQSYDPDEAEGVRLEQLGRMRLLERIAGELDPAYRRAITNADRARFDLPDIERAAAGIDGVTWVRAYATGRCSDIQGMPSRSVALAVIGGDSGAICEAIRPHVVPGIDLYGNERTDLLVEGRCRTFWLVRPTMTALGLNLVVRLRPDANGCPPPATTAIAETIATAFTGAGRPANGVDMKLHLLRTILAVVHPNVELLSGTVTRLPDTTPLAMPLLVPFLAMATVQASDIAINTA